MSFDMTQWIERLPEQRWFGHKGRAITSVEIVDQGRLDEGEEPLMLAIVKVTFADGGSLLYHLPIVVGDDSLPRDALNEV
ncbi:MAG: maltokinase N-terminal cap-like domain-containing protein, partial [Actinomycetota bacterium]